MLYRQIFFELVERDLWLLLSFLFWYSLLTVLPGMIGGMLAQRYVRGNFDFSPSKSHVRCLYASLVTFLVMVVIGLAANWWEAKQYQHRVAWCAATLLAGFVVPFLWEMYAIHAPPSPTPTGKASSRWRVSLRRIVLVQLILLVIGGLWVGGIRQEVASKIEGRRQQSIWHEREDRFTKLGWGQAPLASEGPKYQLRLRCFGLTNPSAGLLEVRPDDQIISLEIRHTELSNADLQVIGKFATLEQLAISSTTLNAGLTELCELRELKRLTLVATSIDTAALIKIAQLPNLKELGIECDQLNDGDLTELCRSTSVPGLYVNSKAVTDQALPEIQANKTLQAVYIRGSKISRKAAVELRDKRPDLNGWFNQIDDPFNK